MRGKAGWGRRGWRFLAGVVLAVGLLGIGAPAGAGSERVWADDTEQQVIALVNNKRAEQGLAPLAVSTELTHAARAYAQQMASQGFFSHTAPDGTTFVTRDEAAGYQGWTYLEENLAAGQTTPAQAVAAWMNSPSHREDILSPDVRETGVGYTVRPGSPYVYYWVQEFGDRPNAPQVSFGAPLQPAAPASAIWHAPTGHGVSGDWLSFVESHGYVDGAGLPRTDVFDDALNAGQPAQYFQRMILDWHPENPPGQQIQRRLLGDMLYPGADPPTSAGDAPPGPSTYFPLSQGAPTGLGHFVADYTRSGQPIYFKSFFDAHGGVATFGYPKEEPKLRNGLWTQRFQAGVFQYHPEDDRDGSVAGTATPLRAYRVQLELLGDEYIQMKGLGYR